MPKPRIRPRYHTVEDIRFSVALSPETIRSAINYKPSPEDVFVITFPKCGTTWIQHIVYLIYNAGKPLANFGEFIQKTPFLEESGAEGIESMPRPGIIKIHLPFHKAPHSPLAKYIYVARNPKDTCVSFFHHTKGFFLYEFSEGTFKDYFEVFMNGENDYGDYFDHTLSWYEHRNDENILFLTYEELKFNTKKEILRIANFLGKEWKDLLEGNDEIFKNVLKYSSINHMRTVMAGMQEIDKIVDSTQNVSSGVKYLADKYSKSKIEHQPFEFVRKGIVGDWKTLFSKEQARRMDEKSKLKLGETQLYELWKNFGIFK